MTVGRSSHNFVKKGRKVGADCSVSFLSLFWLRTGGKFLLFLNIIPPGIPELLLHNGIAFWRVLAPKTLKVNEINLPTISIETGIQNSGLGLALIFNPRIFPSELELGGMAFIAAWWGIWHIVAGLVLAFYWRKKSSKLNSVAS
jgi:BASS family bile acid:Na+ symporter